MIRRVSFVLAIAALFHTKEAHSFQLFSGGPLANKARQQQQHEETLQRTLGIPDGLMDTLLKNNDAFSKRIWIVDNSGSMGMVDGHRIMSPEQDCTRWKELEETVLLHAQLSSALQQPTEFRLLNTDQGTSSFRVGHNTMRNSLKQAQTVLSKTKPAGKTPLSESIDSIRNEIILQLPQLKADGSKVAIVIVTDGCNHNLENLGQDEREIHQELVQALQSLQGLPVSVVVRLCTDYGPLVDIYNELDGNFDGLDVLDDYRNEAKEVYQHNPWLNYALILHRMREMGQYSQLFDYLDERTLTRNELLEFCILVFGGTRHNMPNPNTDWKGFLEKINRLQSKEKMQLNPRTQEMAPWIDIEGLAMLE
jgi:hypothetical protein